MEITFDEKLFILEYRTLVRINEISPVKFNLDELHLFIEMIEDWKANGNDLHEVGKEIVDIMYEIIEDHNDNKKIIEDEHWACVDCNKLCYDDNRDYYMVTDEIWKKQGVGDGMLCMDCMEERLGHKLTKEDILVCPLTQVGNLYTSTILNTN